MRFYQEVMRDGYTLRGMIHRPDNCSGKVPMVVMLHGFKGNKLVKNQMFLEAAQCLEKCGIASARFDFMGSGESDGELVEMSLRSECADADRILDFVKTLDFVDTRRIGLYGTSLGGVIATMVASKRSREIASLFLSAPAFSIQHEITIKKKMVGFDVRDAYRLGYFDAGGDKVGIGFLADVRNLDLEHCIAGYPHQTMIIHGTEDPLVDYRFSEYYVHRFPKGRLKLTEGADHTWLSLPYRAELYETITSFFAETLAGEA